MYERTERRLLTLDVMSLIGALLRSYRNGGGGDDDDDDDGRE